MKTRLCLAVAMLCALGTAKAVPVTPIQNPHVTFVDAAGEPCNGCRLFTYVAGSTTPLATYTDSAGVSTNTNPIVLDASGGAYIWLGRNSYKFILKTSGGVTIWTVDNVNAANLFPCAPAGAIQFANSGVNGLDCDSQITIDKINHTLSVGVLPTNHVTIGALSTPTSWFFDTTSASTACASIGCSTAHGTVTTVSVVTANGVSAIVANPTTTPALTFTLGAITPSSIALNAGTAMTANQGTGTKVQHSTGSTTTGHVGTFDAAGNIVDSGSPLTAVPFATVTDVTGSRSFGTSFQNTGTTTMYVSGYGSITGGSGDSTITCAVGASSPSMTVWSEVVEATAAGRPVAFACMVPPAYFYSLSVTNIISSTPTRWVEYQ